MNHLRSLVIGHWSFVIPRPRRGLTPPRPLFFFHHLALLSVGIFLAADACAQEVTEKVMAFWQTSQSEASSAQFTALRETVGNRDITGPATTTARILVDADAPGGKALVFDGRQTEPLKTSQRLTHDGNVALTLWVRPEKGESAQSIVYFYRSFELRYFQNEGTIKLIVWPEGDSRPIELAAPINVGVWNAIHASLKGRDLELLVNGKIHEAKIPPSSPTVPFFSGYMTLGHGARRPFTGALAEIMVSSLKP